MDFFMNKLPAGLDDEHGTSAFNKEAKEKVMCSVRTSSTKCHSTKQG